MQKNNSPTYPQSLDASLRDLLAIVDVHAAKIIASHQMIKTSVGDRRTIVQLEHLQMLGGSVAGANVFDAIVGDLLTMRKSLLVER